MRLFLELEEFVVYGCSKTFVNTVRCFIFKRKQEKTQKRLTYQPFHLAKISFGMRATTVAYIWKKLLTAAVELTNITEYGWQSNIDIHCWDKPIPTEIEELLVDGDDDINEGMEYEYGNEVESDNQKDRLG